MIKKIDTSIRISKQKKRGLKNFSDSSFCLLEIILFHLVNDCLESLRIIHCEVSEHLTVDLDTCLVDKTHQTLVGEVLQRGGSIDTLGPESAEITPIVLAAGISVGMTFFPSVLGNGPYVFAGAKVAACEFKNLLATLT